jgi:hypothetical protein
MTIKTEGVHTGEFLLRELDNLFSREVIVVPEGEGKLPAGTLLNADNEKVAGAAADTAVKVLYEAVDATDEDVKAVAVARGAVVFGEKLNLTGYSADQKLLAALTLKDLDIIVRWQEEPIPSGQAAKVVFVEWPATGNAGEDAGGVVAHVQTLLGQLVNGDNTTSVTLTKKSGTGGAGTITGGGAAVAAGGVVTWPALTFSAAGTYQLTIAASGLTGADSPAIEIAA